MDILWRRLRKKHFRLSLVNHCLFLVPMTPTRNIHRMLTTVLFTVGVGLLLVGASAGPTSFSGAGKPVQVSRLPLQVAARVTVQDLVHPAFELNRVSQVFHAAPASGAHKNPKHFRNRYGSDLLYSSFSFNHDHPLFISQSCEYRGRLFSAALVIPSLRGPPVA